MRLIDADALIEILIHNKKINKTDQNDASVVVVDIDAVIRCIEKQPTTSMMSEQVKELREIANGINDETRRFQHWSAKRLILEAADTIESLSAKLQAANMERSAEDCGGWIPCNERMPEENQNVIACFAHGTVTELRFYDKKFRGIYDYDEKVIVAWMPLPKAYGELHEP